SDRGPPEPCHPEEHRDEGSRSTEIPRFARERAFRAHGDERSMLTLSAIGPPSLVPKGLDDSGAPSPDYAFATSRSSDRERRDQNGARGCRLRRSTAALLSDRGPPEPCHPEEHRDEGSRSTGIPRCARASPFRAHGDERC